MGRGHKRRERSDDEIADIDPMGYAALQQVHLVQPLLHIGQAELSLPLPADSLVRATGRSTIC